MAPAKRASKAQPASKVDSPPAPFKQPPEVLAPFISTLNKKHVYITHIDKHDVELKRKVFFVPVVLNITIALLFLLRMWWILPWYWKLVLSGLGNPNETTFVPGEASWGAIVWEVSKRAFVMLLDFLLFVFVWPWPVEFVAGQARGNPCQWRWQVGYRKEEIYVRRSREWDRTLKDIFSDKDSKTILYAYIRQATSPILQEQKTGYLLVNGYWDLDWKKMVHAHKLVDKKDIALEAFRNVVLVHHKDYGWMCFDVQVGASSSEEVRRRQVFAFRDTLTAMGKENLFYHWVEVVQFEATQPGGFGPEKQETAAKKIRDMFEAENINFDELWKESVGALEF